MDLIREQRKKIEEMDAYYRNETMRLEMRIRKIEKQLGEQGKTEEPKNPGNTAGKMVSPYRLRSK